LRNEFARSLGYEDFYAYKACIDENMSKKELFSIFEKIYERTKFAFKDIRKLEKEKPGLRKPWNFAFMMTGDMTVEEDQYYPFEKALSYWGRSFSSLGIDLKGGSIKMDLLDRKGKYNNGFCHYPTLVQYRNGKRMPASSGISSNTLLGQPGAAAYDIGVLFHEGGHAVDRLNSMQPDACINHEYPPSSVSWSETHSMFMEALYSSIEWRTRYAENDEGRSYPFGLFERKVRATHPLRPLSLMYIMLVVFFEKEVYETKDLNKERLIEIAKRVNRKFNDRSVDSISILNLPHLYSWESSAYYHGYGLAQLGVSQWREYFLKKYGYIVDNPKVGEELMRMWSLASLYPTKKLIRMATGKPLSAESYIKDATSSVDEILKSAKTKMAKLEKVPMSDRPINLRGRITMVHGKNKIADNTESFEDMAEKYSAWLKTQR
jgi:oligoendopeptidase F